MTTPFVGEIRLFAHDQVPGGWVACDGQLLAINAAQTLFSLLGTTYGGDGDNTFGLPDLRGRTPVGVDAANGKPLGLAGGEEDVVLVSDQLPAHNHAVNARNVDASLGDPTDAVPSTIDNNLVGYADPNNLVQMNPDAVSDAGQSNPAGHNNMQPYLTVGFYIALTGIFPSP